MAFVTCTQFSQSQAEQDNKLAALEKANESKNAEQDNKLAALEKANESKNAEQDNKLTELEECCTANKQKNIEQDEAIAALKQNALTAVTVKPNSGLTGNGTTANPLGLNLSDILTALKSGNLLGEGLDVAEGKLVLKLNRIVDASGGSKVTMGVNNG